MKKLWVPAIFAALFVSGCGGGGGNDHQRVGALRFIAASPDAPFFNVYVNGSKEATALGYAGFSYYLFYNEGSERVQYRPALTNTNSLDLNIGLSDNQYKTVVAYNDFNHLKSMVLDDDRSTPPDGLARVRLLNLSPSSGKVDIYVLNPATNYANVSPTYSNVAFEANTGFANFPGAFYRVVITRAGTKNALLDTGGVYFGSQEVRTVFILDKKGGGTPDMGLIQYDLN